MKRLLSPTAKRQWSKQPKYPRPALHISGHSPASAECGQRPGQARTRPADAAPFTENIKAYALSPTTGQGNSMIINQGVSSTSVCQVPSRPALALGPQMRAWVVYSYSRLRRSRAGNEAGAPTPPAPICFHLYISIPFALFPEALRAGRTALHASRSAASCPAI